MLYYGMSSMLPYLNDATSVYNITSYREGLCRLNLLPPFDKRLFTDGCRDFDLAYAEYIFNNDYVFFDFFKIVYDLYLGKDVFLVMDDGDWSENIIESILKLIQQRYGYNGCLLTGFDSYIYAQNNINSSFESFGLYNLDQDKNRFSAIWMQLDPKIVEKFERMEP